MHDSVTAERSIKHNKPSIRIGSEARPAEAKGDSPRDPTAAGRPAPRSSAASSPLLLPIRTSPGTDSPSRKEEEKPGAPAIAGVKRQPAGLRIKKPIRPPSPAQSVARAHKESSFLAAGGREVRESWARKKNLAVAARKGRKGKGGRLFLSFVMCRRYPWQSGTLLVGI